MKDHRFYKKVTHGAKGPVLTGAKSPWDGPFAPFVTYLQNLKKVMNGLG